MTFIRSSLHLILWYSRFCFWNLEDTNFFMLPGGVITSYRTICSRHDVKFQLFSQFVSNSMNVCFNVYSLVVSLLAYSLNVCYLQVFTKYKHMQESSEFGYQSQIKPFPYSRSILSSYNIKCNQLEIHNFLLTKFCLMHPEESGTSKSASPKLLNLNQNHTSKKRLFWSNPYKIELMATFLIEIQSY